MLTKYGIEKKNANNRDSVLGNKSLMTDYLFENESDEDKQIKTVSNKVSSKKKTIP